MFSTETYPGTMDDFGVEIAMKHFEEAGYKCFRLRRGTPYFDFETYQDGRRHYVQVETRNDTNMDGTLKEADYNLFYAQKA